MARSPKSQARELKRKPPRISVTLEPEEYAALARIADAEDRSMDWLGAQAVKAYLQIQAGRSPELVGGQAAIDFVKKTEGPR